MTCGHIHAVQTQWWLHPSGTDRLYNSTQIKPICTVTFLKFKLKLGNYSDDRSFCAAIVLIQNSVFPFFKQADSVVYISLKFNTCLLIDLNIHDIQFRC